MKKAYIIIPICALAFVAGLVATMIFLKASADRYTLNDLIYERAEPEREWKSHDYAVFVTPEGNKVKYLCPEYICQSMVYGSKYDVTIIDGDFALPSIKVNKVMPK